jgi:hypothetical protein
MPDRPAPNTKIEFTRQVTVGGVSFPAKYVVTLSPSSFTPNGGKTVASLAGIDAVASSLSNADESGNQEAMLFEPFGNGINKGRPNIEWASRHLISPGSKNRLGQNLGYTDEVVCTPILMATPEPIFTR